MDKNERLVLVQDLLNETNQRIRSNSIDYVNFLRTAGNNFKYTASEQKLIYAQKPDATAVAMSMVWFRRFRRAVNRGTKAIWLLSYRGSTPSPYYVFDISDTHSLYKEGFALWQAQSPEYVDELQNKLKERYDVDGISFEDTVFNAVHSLIKDESDSSQNFSTAERLFVEESTRVMVSARCGIDYNSDYINSFHISELTTEKMNDIIQASSYYSYTILTQIEQIVHECIRNILTERSNSNGRDNVHGQNGSADPEHSNPGAPEDREVRNNAASLSDGAETRNIYDNVGEQHAESALGADRPTGEKTVGEPDSDHAEESRSDRGAESTRSDVVGSEDDQHSQRSGGNRSERTDLQLTDDDKAGEQSPALSLLDIELIKGTPIQNGKYRIYEEFLYNDSSIDEKAKFLKEEYGWGGMPGKNFYVNFSPKGLVLNPFGDFSFESDKKDDLFYNWTTVAKEITKLIEKDQYFTASDAAYYYPKYKKHMHLVEIRSNIAHDYRELIKEYSKDYPDDLNQYPLSDSINQFIVGNRLTSTLHTDPTLDFVIIYMREGLLTILEHEDSKYTDRAANIYNKLLADIAEPFNPTAIEEILLADYKERNYDIYPDDTVKIDSSFIKIIDINDSTIITQSPSTPLIQDEYEKPEFFEMMAKENYNIRFLDHYQDVKKERKPDPNNISFEDNDDNKPYYEDDITDKNELPYEKEEPVPYITCLWSEHPSIDYVQDYSILEFDELTEKADLEQGTEKGYAKVKYRIIFPDNTSVEHRIDLGEKKGGFLSCLEQLPSYEKYVGEFRKLKLFQEYQRTQAQNPNSIIWSRIGDFYETFESGAEKASAVLDIVLTRRRIYDDYRVPMTGIPVYKAEEYTYKLRKQGYDSIFLLEPNPELASKQDDQKQSEEIKLNSVIIDLRPSEVIEAERNRALIGKNLKIDDRDFVIENVSDSGEVVLRDLTFQNATGFPIYRSEKLEFIYSILNDQKATASTVAPDAPNNYKITSDTLGVNTPKKRFNANIKAIKTLYSIESENRQPTEEEKDVLSNYVGWGGLSEAFDERKTSWSSEYNELINLLTPEEYEAARSSTLSAFYTQPILIKTIYSVLKRAGFKGGRILEPSCGIGNFFGLLPDSMENSQLYGVELDDISGRIAKVLYPTANIQIKGFENTSYEDNSFDVVIGNVPFGDYQVNDRRYNKLKYKIHDYFFAKALDKVRAGGIVAFITYMGTLDKESVEVRKYIAQRAEFLGAIRLPNTAFKDAAGTDVTSDIIFLQKRENIIDIEPDWIFLEPDANGIVQNSHYVQNPNMIIGHMEMKSGRFGDEATCKLHEDDNYYALLEDAAYQIDFSYNEQEIINDIADTSNDILPADPDVRNFSYTLVNGKVYFRTNDIMEHPELNGKKLERIKGMLQIRDTLRTLIEYQVENYEDKYIKEYQDKLNILYDDFVKKFGRISSRANSSAFSEDSSYYLLTSLEIFEKNEFKCKADIFHKRTIKPAEPVTHVETSVEALNLSIAEYAGINMEYMIRLTDKSEEDIITDLRGIIFLNPQFGYGDKGNKYLTTDEYLSGNVREKLKIAERSAELYPDDFDINVAALKQVQPEDLSASEISVRIGATWVPVKYYEQFLYQLFKIPKYNQYRVHVNYNEILNSWRVTNKTFDFGNVTANTTFGTSRINGYSLFELSLNLQEAKIYDTKYESDGSKKRVLNSKETTLALAKQDKLKQAFLDWIWKDPTRRQELCRLYNDKFNAIRPREYDGSHIIFPEMNPEITLREHQRNAIARILYGGNTLLAHVVGAGKTFEMVAAAQESHRLGLSSKAMFVVPNHIIGQFATEYLQLYPAANILVASKNDFTPANRKKFCSRIATGNYDSVIIGHSQFEKIPMSKAKQVEMLNQEMDDIVGAIINAEGDHLTIKRLETMKKRIQTKIDKLNDLSEKDDVVTFEELGVDMLFVDEAHYFKNLATITKMSNVAGIGQTEAKKSSDLYLKCRYMDEITGGRGIVFATGTPISNSMVELYTMQRYLQYDTLAQNGLINFDSWASTFGETVNAIELDPTGNGYRNKTRFSRFYNLPELISMFKEVADIKTSDMVQLDVPKSKKHIITLPPSETQLKLIKEFSKRADKIFKKQVNSSEDNMLCITNDGRKLALDQRILDPSYPDEQNNKAAACAKRVYRWWKRTRSHGVTITQVIFSDLSTPKKDGSFTIYQDIKDKLITYGMPSEQIQFVHDAETDAAKNKLFDKVRSGEVAVLMGSTSKMGAGTNVQNRLKVLYHLDCTWRPADLQQREGRIVRQGNTNKLVHIYTFVTEKTFDSYMYQMVERKQKFIGQIMTSKTPVRIAEDIDEQALSYAEIKALCSGNPLIKERMELENDVAKLKLERASHQSNIYSLQDRLIKDYPKALAFQQERVSGIKADIKTGEQYSKIDDHFSMIIDETTYTERKKAGQEIIKLRDSIPGIKDYPFGSYRGFNLVFRFDLLEHRFYVRVDGNCRYSLGYSNDPVGIITRLENAIDKLPELLKKEEEKLHDIQDQIKTAEEEITKPFEKEEEFQQKTARLEELTQMLNMDKDEHEDAENDAKNIEIDERNIV